jgi:hypothetical protein
MGVLAGCTMNGGCPLNIDCSYSDPSQDPLATTDPDSYDIYDACIVAGMEGGGFSASDVAWMGALMKGQGVQEGGQITPSSSNGAVDDSCGGQNCGMWSISAGASSGDRMPGGVCGVTMNDPLTGQQDWSHSYALFQDTPGCEGTFLVPTAPAGYMVVGTGTGDIVPWNQTQKVFYAEAEASLGVMNLGNQTVKGVIDAVMDPTDPWYKQSIFYPAYNLFVHMGYTFAYQYQQAQGTSTGCDPYQKMYKTVAYWLNGDISNDCNVPTGGGQGGDLNYVNSALNNYQMMYGQPWPYEAPQ